MTLPMSSAADWIARIPKPGLIEKQPGPLVIADGTGQLVTIADVLIDLGRELVLVELRCARGGTNRIIGERNRAVGIPDGRKIALFQ